ncbi:hypothetical protein N431DRAFT_478822 [Stipitochalara longipes BDJ]|nr:hypothetical protein N431DRAFT_478822 [Stipitochalara longipes BDJ]
MSIPISGLAAITDGWGLAFGADSTVTVTSSMNGTSKSSTTPRYPAYIKGIDTSLTATALLLMAATYYLVIKDATPLGNYCKLPSKVISANVQALLGEVWPLGAVVTKVEEKYRNDLNSLVRWNFTPEKESRRFEQLLYIGRNDVLKEATLLDTGYTKEQMMAQDNYTSPPQYGKKYKFSKDKLFDPSQTFVPKCIQQCELENQAQERPTTRRIWLRNKSDAVKNLVLLAIWEWISLWLVIITVVSTTIYNGFAASDGNPDRYPRLVLVRVYTFAFVLHFCYTWVCFCRTYTNLVLNGCWTLLSNANFAVQIDDEVFTGIQNSHQSRVCS